MVVGLIAQAIVLTELVFIWLTGLKILRATSTVPLIVRVKWLVAVQTVTISYLVVLIGLLTRYHILSFLTLVTMAVLMVTDVCLISIHNQLKNTYGTPKRWTLSAVFDHLR
jgi:hypothetical protein